MEYTAADSKEALHIPQLARFRKFDQIREAVV